VWNFIVGFDRQQAMPRQDKSAVFEEDPLENSSVKEHAEWDFARSPTSSSFRNHRTPPPSATWQVKRPAFIGRRK